MIAGLSPALERILEAGNSAPSGENSQPWHFTVRGNEIDVHLVPERNESAYGWGHRASYLACGAAIENIVIAASEEKMRATVEVLPHNDDPLLVARVSLVADAIAKADPLAEMIATRSTNRKAYSTDPLTPSQREALLSLESEAALPVLVEKREDIKRLARVGSTNEEIMLANHGLHQFFFSHVNWTKDEDEARKVGFFIDTLELPPPARLMFKVFRHWGIMRLLIRAGMQRFVAIQNAATNGATSAIGGILISR